MSWTMPRRVLRVVALLLILASAGAFALGVASTPQHGGRLPGQKIPGSVGVGPSIEATDATPLSDERIEGPPPPTPEELAKAQAKQEKDAGDQADEAEAPAPMIGNAAPAPPPVAPPPGNATEAEPPAEAPY